MRIDGAGRTVGSYELVRRLGEGGAGVVWEAWQRSPRRLVALKLLHPGRARAARRFRREAELLGWLDHPGIARVYESGVAETPAGPQPFIAMELVRGERIDGWLARRATPARERLALLARLCDAVHHAHQRGVVHRDLKAANVLVDERGQPRVLDFGVAHAAGGEDSRQTAAGEVVGTLASMSPEQVRGEPGPPDPRDDVYALGVLAYELLGGRRPFALEGLALHEAARVVLEQEPEPLSRLDSLWRGDVEVIVAKAMAKERARRYASAEELGRDLRRVLDGEPILARPASRALRLARFARRHRSLVATLAAVLVALLLATATSTALWLRLRHESRASEALANAYRAEARANEERARAERREAETANAAVGFLQEVFESSDPFAPAELDARQLVERAAGGLGPDAALDPAARARLLGLLGRACAAMGLAERGRALLAEAHAAGAAAEIARDAPAGPGASPRTIEAP